MAYAQATLTNANSANTFVGVLDGLLTTAGWSTVETLTPSGTLRNRVYKSSGLTNQCGYDWYLVVRWDTVGSEKMVEVWAAEAYNDTTHVVSGMTCAMMGANGDLNTFRSTQPTTGYFTDATINLNTVGVTPAKTYVVTYKGAKNITEQAAPGFQTLTPSSAFAYWMSVTLDHVALFTTVVGGQNAVIATLDLEADYTSDTNFSHTPIISWDDANFTLSSGLLGIDMINNSTYRSVHASYSGTFGAKLPALTDTYYDAYACKPEIYFDMIFGQGGTPSFEATALVGGVVAGAVIDFYVVYGGAIGDTVTIAGATYVLTGRMDSKQPNQNQPTFALLVE